MSTGNVWFTSDPHFGHEKVAVEKRLFASTHEHDMLIERRWRAVVKPEDQVWVLGDLATSHFDYALELIDNLPGAKHLISGNHDPVHSMHKNAHKYQDRVRLVFDSIQTMAHRKMNGEDVLLSHYPYAADHTTVPRHMQWRLPNLGAWLLHGHNHTKIKHIHGTKEISVGVDAWDFYPASINEIVKIMRDENTRGE